MVYAKFSCKQVFGFTKFLDVLSRIVCHMCGAPENGVIRGVSLGAAGVESVLSGALDAIGLRMGLHTSQGNVLFLFPLLSMGPCWCNDFFLFFFCQVLWSGDTCLEISHASMSFRTKCRRSLVYYEFLGALKSQLIAFQYPISNMCAYDFCSLIAWFARFFCSMQLLYMSLQFGRFHAMLKMGSAGAGKGIAIKV